MGVASGPPALDDDDEAAEAPALAPGEGDAPPGFADWLGLRVGALSLKVGEGVGFPAVGVPCRPARMMPVNVPATITRTPADPPIASAC